MCTTVASCFMTSCGRAMERREAARAFTDCKRACVRDAGTIRAAVANASCGRIVAELNRTMADLNCLAPDAVEPRAAATTGAAAAADAGQGAASAAAGTQGLAATSPLGPLLASSISTDQEPSGFAVLPEGHSGWRQSLQPLGVADGASIPDAFGERAAAVGVEEQWRRVIGAANDFL